MSFIFYRGFICVQGEERSRFSQLKKQECGRDSFYLKIQITFKADKRETQQDDFSGTLQDFKEWNRELYSDREIENFIEAMNKRDISYPHYKNAAHLFDDQSGRRTLSS